LFHTSHRALFWFKLSTSLLETIPFKLKISEELDRWTQTISSKVQISLGPRDSSASTVIAVSHLAESTSAVAE